MLHFAGHEQLLELIWERGSSLRNVNISNDQDELAYTIHCHFLFFFYVSIFFPSTEFNYNIH